MLLRFKFFTQSKVKEEPYGSIFHKVLYSFRELLIEIFANSLLQKFANSLGFLLRRRMLLKQFCELDCLSADLHDLLLLSEVFKLHFDAILEG